MSLFHTDNANGVNEYWDDFMDFVRSLSIEHLDVFSKFFYLSLRKDVRRSFTRFLDNKLK